MINQALAWILIIGGNIFVAYIFSRLFAKKWQVVIATGVISTAVLHVIAYFVDDGFGALIAISVLVGFLVGAAIAALTYRYFKQA